MGSGTGLNNLLRELGIWSFGCVVVFASVWYADDIARIIKPVADRTLQMSDAVLRETASKSEPNRSEDNVSGGNRVFLTADQHNQFFAKARINGRPIDVLIDTGASHVSLRYEDARAAGIYVTDRDFTHSAKTANGTTRVAPVMIDQIRIGDITVREIRGLVGEPGKNFVTLLGMAYLSKLQRVNISGRRLELVK